MFKPATRLKVTAAQKGALRKLIRNGKTPQKTALRARIVLMAAEGLPNNAIAKELNVSRSKVLRWRDRFKETGVNGLLKDASRPGRKPALSEAVVKRIVKKTLYSKPKGATHWTSRSLAEALNLSHMVVYRVWRQHKLQPHRVETFKLSTDPHFIEKVEDIVGLYLNPPEKALVFSVDEKSQIQALDRTAPVLPLRPGIPARMTHDYERHGTTTLFAALNILDGKVIGRCAPRHRAREFVDFLNLLDRQTPKHLQVHLIVDNASSHKSPEVKQWMKKHSRFIFHFTPTSSSWINLVERWFGEITQKRIRRGTFKSVRELERAIREYLDIYNTKPHKFIWTKSADVIIEKVAHCIEALDTGH